MLTYRWGTADETEVHERFSVAGGVAPPVLIRADVSSAADTGNLMAAIRDTTERIDTFVSNAAGSTLVTSMEDLNERALLKTMQYSAWPTIGYVRAIKNTFGTYPRYIVAVSSTGPDCFSMNYDFIAASKAALETLCRYLAHRLRKEKDSVRVNVVRTLGLQTGSFRDVFGDKFGEYLAGLVPEDCLVREEDVADTILALCSGLMDGVNGQIITVDKGSVFADNIMRLYAEREVLSL